MRAIPKEDVDSLTLRKLTDCPLLASLRNLDFSLTVWRNAAVDLHDKPQKRRFVTIKWFVIGLIDRPTDPANNAAQLRGI